MIPTFGTGQASSDDLSVCRVILESDPQQVVHRVALRVSRNVQPLLSTSALKLSLLSVAEGAAPKHILPFPILTCVDPSPAFPPQCTREVREFVCFSNMEPSILYGLAQNGHFNVNILNEQSKRSINIHDSETLKEHEVGFENGSSHQRRWSVFPVLV